MDFLKIFFKEETVVGLCAFGLKKTVSSTIGSNFLNQFESKKTFVSDYSKNIMLSL